MIRGVLIGSAFCSRWSIANSTSTMSSHPSDNKNDLQLIVTIRYGIKKESLLNIRSQFSITNNYKTNHSTFIMARSTFIVLLISAAALFLSSVDAFSMQHSRAVEGLQSRAASKKMLASILKMSEEGEQQEDVASKISADGTFYDDEVRSILWWRTIHRDEFRNKGPCRQIFSFLTHTRWFSSFRLIRHPWRQVSPILWGNDSCGKHRLDSTPKSRKRTSFCTLVSLLPFWSPSVEVEFFIKWWTMKQHAYPRHKKLIHYHGEVNCIYVIDKKITMIVVG